MTLAPTTPRKIITLADAWRIAGDIHLAASKRREAQRALDYLESQRDVDIDAWAQQLANDVAQAND